MSVTSKSPFRSVRSAVRARHAPDPVDGAPDEHVPQLPPGDRGDAIMTCERARPAASGLLDDSSIVADQQVNGHNTDVQDAAPMLRLADEILLMILDHIEADPEKAISVDNRLYLSRESFSFPHPPHPDHEQAIGNFRLVCRRFSELGAVRQFERLTTRFSQKGFKRLEDIAQQKHLAKCVRKFSYMVPYFYRTDRESVREMLPNLNGGSLDVEHYVARIEEQRSIIDSEEDLRVLKEALAAFQELQHVQILPVQDQHDQALLSYIRNRQDLSRLVELNWAPACSRSTRTIGEALMAAHSNCSRFSSPMLNPQTPIILAKHPPGVGTGLSHGLESLADRLTCLELHFDGEMDLDAQMYELSPLFRIVFNAARNMQAVHVGFPSYRPVSLPLEDVFHNVRWEKLVAFGIQGWKLHTEEIVNVASRHRDRLKGIRLRDVQLKEGSMWKDLLGYLRNNMRRLDWVSLRRIGYAKAFDEHMSQQGVEVPDDPLDGYSGDEDDDWEDPDLDPYASLDANGTAAGPSQNHVLNHHNYHNYDSDGESIGSESSDSAHSHIDDENGPDAHDMGFPSLNSPDTPTSGPFCNCGERERNGGKPDAGPEDPEELGDNGIFVNPETRRMWEKWVVRRCPEHSAR